MRQSRSSRGRAAPYFNKERVVRESNSGETIMRYIGQFLNDEAGATAIEYGLLAALISVGAMAAITLVGTKMSTGFSTIGSALT